MSMQDPIADMLTRIRNGQMAKKQSIEVSQSKIKSEIARVLKEEGYIRDYNIQLNDEQMGVITIELKYYHGRPVIEKLERISKPSLRIYKSSKELKPIPGFGIAILTTSKGVMTHVAAKSLGVGGEILCEVA